MGTSRSLRTAHQSALALLLSSAVAFACSARHEIDRDASDSNALAGGGAAAGANASGGLGMSATSVSGAGSAAFGAGGNNLGLAGFSGSFGSGGNQQGGVAGAAVEGSHDAGSRGAVGGGEANVGGAPSGGASESGVCRTVAAEYATELDKQLLCTPGAGQQCTNRAVAAPGCECRIFIQPSNPFAIEHLSNLASGWYDADCSMQSCSNQCTTATAGACQPDSDSALGGRCVTP